MKKVGSRERKFASGSETVPFRNGNIPAIAYVGLVALVALLSMLWSYPASMGRKLDSRLISGLVITLVALICSRTLLGLISRDILKRNSRLLMLCIVGMFSIFFSAVCLWAAFTPTVQDMCPFDISEIYPFLFPYMFAPAMATLLAGPAAGISIGAGAMIFNMLFVKDETIMPALTIGAIISVVAPRLLAGARRRSALLRAFIIACGMQLFGVIVYLITQQDITELSDNLLNATSFSVGATVFSCGFAFAATIILLPLLEHFFAATSNIRLNEYADLGHPVLQKLSLEAPGTYHHSIVVATLAAAAAERIGANALLARVGSYYHDIGKLTKPAFYAENIGVDQKNPHTEISPNMSAVIIAAHVKEGIGLALHYNLPPPIRDIIREHHGTSVMTWFLHKAKEEAKAKAEKSKSDPEPVDESQFRYSGPRPTTREAGIVLLADSVEAASRSLERPVPAAIENLVNNIVTSKIQDEQLDCCQLTFVDVATVKRTFTATLSNILHARIPYPKDDDAKEVHHDTDNRSPTP